MTLSPTSWPGGSASADSAAITASETLTNAQVLALVTTPIEIVAAPGAGKVIVPLFSAWVCDASAGAYTNFNAFSASNPFASSVYLAWDGLVNFNDASGPIRADQLLGVARVSYSNIGPITASLIVVNALAAGNDALEFAGANAAAVGYEDVPLHVVGQNNTLGNFTGGNAANSLIVTVVYTLLSF